MKILNYFKKPIIFNDSFSFVVLWSLLGLIINLLILIAQLKYMPTSPSLKSSLYLTFAVIGYQGFIWFLCGVIFWLLFRAIPSFASLKLAILSIGLVLFNTLYFINVKIYGLYKFHLNKSLINFLLSEAMGDLSTINFGPIAFASILIICFSFVSFILLKFINQSCALNPRLYIKVKNFWLVFLVLIVFATQSYHMYADAIGDTKISFWSRHIPYYFPLTGKRFLLKMGVVSANQIQGLKLKNFHDPSINYPSNLKFECKLGDKKINIIYILVDSLRKDVFNEQNMPKTLGILKSLKGVKYYNNHYSGGNATSTGIFSLFYSIPGTYYKNFSNSRIGPLFFNILEKNNYQTQISFSSSISTTTFARNVFKNIKNLRLDTPWKEAWKSDQYVNNEFKEFIKKQNDTVAPFFGLIFYDSVHDYSFPPDFEIPYKNYWANVDYSKLNMNTNPELFFNRYKNSVFYIDSLIEELISFLKSTDKLKDTFVVISSDHGEEFNDNHQGYWGHNGNYSDVQVKVPMVVIQPDRINVEFSDNEFNHSTTHYDVAPHILKTYFNCPSYSNYTVGHSLDEKQKTRKIILASYSTGALRNSDHIYVFNTEGSMEIFDNNYIPDFETKINREDYQYYLKQTTRFYK